MRSHSSVGVPETADRGTICHSNAMTRWSGSMIRHVNDVFASACVLDWALPGALDSNCCMVSHLVDRHTYVMCGKMALDYPSSCSPNDSKASSAW
jgi:hypothetical protein